MGSLDPIIAANLRHLYPLNQLSQSALAELLPLMRVRSFSMGQRLFEIGDSPDDYFYVIQGSIWLGDENPERPPQVIGPVSEQEALPLPYMVPTRNRAHVAEESRLLLVDRRKLEEIVKRPRPKALDLVGGSDGSVWDSVHDAGPVTDEVARVAPPTPTPTPTPPPTLRPIVADRRSAEEKAKDRILLVEDHPTDAKVIQLFLRTLGFSADWVRSGSEAIRSLEQTRYDIVLLDVHLPGVDGFETTRIIRKRWPGAKGPHIIAVTARALQGDREACLAAGMDDYIPKPVSMHLLGAKLNRENWSLVDPKVLENFGASIGTGGVIALIDSFVSSLPGMVIDLRAAIDAREPADVQRAAHSLKTAAKFLGGHFIAGYAEKLEELGKSANLEGAPGLLRQITSVQMETQLELQQLRRHYAEKSPR